MSFGTLLVHMDAGSRRRQRLDLAFTLAEEHDAHLIGLFGLPPLVPPSAEAAPMWMAEVLRQRRELEQTVAQEFGDKMKREQYSGKSEWRSTLDDGLGAIILYARYADLLVADQPDPNGDGVPAGFSRELVMATGRPVLYVPRAGRFERCGSNVLVAWNESREATRAVKDALPMLQKAQNAEVVSFDKAKARAGEDELPDPDMGAYLARHGAKVAVARQPTEIEAGAAILSRAADNAADLIVMGAYSHSRLRELVLGGATRTLFDSMTVPTLMSR
jgi:nucleotide-binding universal stress UspA family protein